MTNLSIEVVCPHCGSQDYVNTRLAGRNVRCRQCDAVVSVPAAPPESVQADEASDVEPPLAAEVPANPAQPADVDAVELRSDDETLQAPIVFASDPVFTAPGHHSAMDLPDLPPALQPDSDDGDPLARTKRKEDELDMTPMVDVTFLLLIFFMVTASFSLQKSIEMPRQQTDLPSSTVQEEVEDPDMVTVQIDEYGSFLVLAPDWERETPGKQNLTAALREAIGGGGGAVRLVIEVHEDAQLRYLVDCMDAGTISGYSEIQVTQVDGFD